ncbi:hypothetical protein KJ644_00835 [Candidatus Dependentiae bacterium]|nr:hypothetical protein [Candidatus Dependentiae bacterium]MBU4386998.1 hypothetical protein [Candidatus Dependentiae bacterium]MCG2756674.1 hypothetical protein [Candidatus Dependentiae bacterium]
MKKIFTLILLFSFFNIYGITFEKPSKNIEAIIKFIIANSEDDILEINGDNEKALWLKYGINWNEIFLNVDESIFYNGIWYSPKLCKKIEELQTLVNAKRYKYAIDSNDLTTIVDAIEKNPNNIKTLILNSNKIGKAGVKILTNLLNSKNCNLKNISILNDQADLDNTDIKIITKTLKI